MCSFTSFTLVSVASPTACQAQGEILRTSAEGTRIFIASFEFYFKTIQHTQCDINVSQLALLYHLQAIHCLDLENRLQESFTSF